MDRSIFGFRSPCGTGATVSVGARTEVRCREEKTTDFRLNSWYLHLFDVRYGCSEVFELPASKPWPRKGGRGSAYGRASAGNQASGTGSRGYHSGGNQSRFHGCLFRQQSAEGVVSKPGAESSVGDSYPAGSIAHNGARQASRGICATRRSTTFERNCEQEPALQDPRATVGLRASRQ